MDVLLSSLERLCDIKGNIEKSIDVEFEVSICFLFNHVLASNNTIFYDQIGTRQALVRVLATGTKFGIQSEAP